MKTVWTTVIFSNECNAILDEPDGWNRGWINQHNSESYGEQVN